MSENAVANSSFPKDLGFYRLVEEVGAGGLGRVFKAVDRRTGKIVALKILHDKLTHNKKFLGIFHRELLIMASLHHKHIVSYLDSYFHPPVCYIITEFVEGWSGYSLYKKVGPMPPVVVLCILIDMLQGIDHLHLHDTIHSDLSAANYLVDKNGRVLVTDFGLSCRYEIEDYKNYMIGTPGYYSPEHVSNISIVPQTDIYCVGLIGYELLTGVKAVPASNDRNLIVKAMKGIDFSRIESSIPKMEVKLRKIFSQALAFNAAKRYKSADQMIVALYDILKRSNIRYARYAIRQFLVEKGLANFSPKEDEQDIHFGNKKR